MVQLTNGPKGTKADFDVIVVGAGFGGATCAALLANKGVNTLLIEMNKHVGGKAMSLSSRGFTYELWPIVGGPKTNSQFEHVINELELELEMVDLEDFATYHYRKASGEIVSFGSPEEREKQQKNLMQMMSSVDLTPENLEELERYRSDVESMTKQEIDELDDISMQEFLERYNFPESLYTYIAIQLNLMFVMPIESIAASEGIKTFKDMFNSEGSAYFKGGYGSFAQKCADTVKQSSGDVLLDTKVKRIIVEDGQVTGVKTDKGVFTAPIVVSNAGIQPTVLKMVGEDHFDKGYVNYIKDLVPSWGGFGIRYFLNKEILKGGLHVIYSDNSHISLKRYQKGNQGEVPEELFAMITVPSEFDPELAPAGKQCVIAASMCPPDPEGKNHDAWLKKLAGLVKEIWPDISNHIEKEEHFTPKQISAMTRDAVLPGQGGEVIGLAQVVGQCGRYKPAANSPVRGLFFVGCDAGGYGIGTHHAVDSGCKVTQQVLRYHQLH